MKASLSVELLPDKGPRLIKEFTFIIPRLEPLVVETPYQLFRNAYCHYLLVSNRAGLWLYF